MNTGNMLNFLQNNLIGIIEDNVIGLTVGTVDGFANKVGYPFGIIFDPSATSEPLFWSLFYYFATRFNPILVYNLFIIGSFLLGLVVAYYFYNHFLNNKYVSMLMSALLVFSPYFYYRSQSHLSLLQVWLLVLVLLLFIKSSRYRHFLGVGILLAILALTSNYLAYMGLLFLGCYFFAHQFVLIFYKDDYWTKKTLISYGLVFVTFIIVVVLALSPYIVANYLPSAAPAATDGRTYALHRSIEDFFVFTSRPWYYFLPSNENPFFGQVTTSVVNYLENDWGNFLAQNYFRSEHSQSYLGIVNFILAIVGLRYVYTFVSKDIKERMLNRKGAYWTNGAILMSLFLTACVLFLFTLPPYIAIKGIYIYTPSYVLFQVFPMFRVLARLGILILLIQLVFTGFGYLWFVKKFNEKFKYGYLAVFGFFIFSLAEFFVPVRITTVSTPPQVYSYIGGTLAASDVIAVYPRGYETEALFWMREHNRALVNVKNFKRGSFDSTSFTDNLKRCQGFAHAKEIGVTHLVYFYAEDMHNDEQVTPFVAMDSLTALANFENNNHPRRYSNFFIKRDNLKNNAAILYRLGDVKCE